MNSISFTSLGLLHKKSPCRHRGSQTCEHLQLTQGEWELSKRPTDQSKLRWVTNTFKPFKSTGSDGTAPAIMQYKACLSTGYTPRAWWQVKVTFTPKPRKANYTETKSCHPISLLKTMENWWIRKSGTRF